MSNSGSKTAIGNLLLSVRRGIKNQVASLLFIAWRFGLYKLFAPRITVLLFHRVSDDVKDNLTVGVEQFDRQMRLIKKYCQPISIDELFLGKQPRKSRKPLVCITFDDGYLDNYSNAARILHKHKIPAAFFVSTGIIDSKGRFPHDIWRRNPYIPVMNWNQLREMRAQGFIIGSHSVNHIDCAVEPEDVVWNELVESREKLREELGLDEFLFAYPYGGRQNMTADHLTLVKKAGYKGCLSAYGGTNVGKVDPYNILRKGIHWEFSDQALLLECLGL